jgi:hypothetical protein
MCRPRFAENPRESRLIVAVKRIKQSIKEKKAPRVAKVTRGDLEAWHVTSGGGHVKTVRIRGSSKRALDEAVTIYGRALQRLANR